MPSKIQLDENLWFLYICLQKSDMKTIDFTAVGQATSLKPPAARMRYTRLRRQIESGTLIGTHGTPFTGEKASEKNREMNQKRKRAPKKEEGSDSDPDRDTPGPGDGPHAAKENETKIKQEEWSSSSGSETEDSEDEMPLAKLRKVNSLKIGGREGAPSPEIERAGVVAGSVGGMRNDSGSQYTFQRASELERGQGMRQQIEHPGEKTREEEMQAALRALQPVGRAEFSPFGADDGVWRGVDAFPPAQDDWYQGTGQLEKGVGVKPRMSI